ncbi:MAG TPA: aspartate/glutamate racemase family protein [Nitrosopumilaceae archaeon]|nr:aspartate/glutamate racemase family protein [Nitrosopumilaceae archaeon]
MVKIAVFDSGLGSLSIIKSIRKKMPSDIIYFADQKNFPYGTKSIVRLRKIINSTISMLEKKFNPDLIVVGSNTPSLLLKDVIKRPNIIGVFPPLNNAIKKSKSNSIAILATKSVVESTALKKYIKKYVPKKIKVVKINASPLVELVESGKFIHDKNLCAIKIKWILNPLLEHDVDVVTLSSTHLPFLLSLLKQIFPQVTFLDPADSVADQIVTKINKKSKRSTMKIFTSGNVKIFQKQLSKIGIKNQVMKL